MSTVNFIQELLVNLFQADGNYSYNLTSGSVDNNNGATTGTLYGARQVQVGHF